eukprot:TRINITY_DN5274_c0_g1_i2.p2 TRINITY_DN5274_c0_g1~~TRINITY_DN5274_c0_g1_i2.p2  ORF type:complete len:175 (+),score=31.06 TRINITY_DN5274_c0_g1_i2:264-788(+)
MRNIVSTVTPLAMVKRWVKSTPVENIAKEDLFRVQQLENSSARLRIVSMLQEKLGHERFSTLARAVAEMEEKRDESIAKTRGIWVGDNATRWRVHSDMVVQGLPGNGERFRDRLEIPDEDRGGRECTVRLGPFILDHARSAQLQGCCWVQADCPGKVMTWRQDRGLASRMMFMW